MSDFTEAVLEVVKALAYSVVGLSIAAIGILMIWVFPGIDRYANDVGPWDEQGLRRGLIVLATLVFLGGLRRIVPKHVQDLLPSGPFWTLVIAAVMALTLLQYTALGGGQPLWSVEHAILHLAELAGVRPTDINVLTDVLHRHLAAGSRVPWAGDVESRRFLTTNAALIVIALGAVGWTESVTRIVFEPAWTVL